MIPLLIVMAVAFTFFLYLASVRGWLMNLFYAACVIVDAMADIACQLWIDISRVWKRKKKINLDEHEKTLS